MAIEIKENSILEYANGDTLPTGATLTIGTKARNISNNDKFTWSGTGWLPGWIVNVMTVANEAALLAEKTAGRMAVKQWYIITSLANLEIQIKFKSPDGNFFYEKIDNDGVIEIVKIE